MPTQFRIEIFGKDYAFKDWAVIEDPTIDFDYLTLDPSTINVPKLLENTDRGQYITISNGYQGIITAVTKEWYTTTLTVKPLLSLLDVTVYYDRTKLPNMTLEGFIADMITQLYVSNTDVVQNIPGMTVSAQTGTAGAKLNLEDNVHDLYAIITKSLTKYSVIIDMVLNPQQKKLTVNIHQVYTAAKTIEADLPGILDKTFTLKDSYGSVNKFVAVDKRDETQQLTFYANGYAAPAVWTTEYIDDDDFITAATTRASDLFTPSDFDNLIELTALANNSLVSLEVGEKANIIKNGVEYSTVMTGYELQTRIVNGVECGLIKLVFGAVRLDLTKILALERRNS